MHFSPTKKPSSSWKKLYRQGRMIWRRNFISQLYTTEERLHTITALLSLANSIPGHMSTSQVHTHTKKKTGSGPKLRKSTFYTRTVLKNAANCLQISTLSVTFPAFADFTTHSRIPVLVPQCIPTVMS